MLCLASAQCSVYHNTVFVFGFKGKVFLGCANQWHRDTHFYSVYFLKEYKMYNIKSRKPMQLAKLSSLRHYPVPTERAYTSALLAGFSEQDTSNHKHKYFHALFFIFIWLFAVTVTSLCAQLQYLWAQIICAIEHA